MPICCSAPSAILAIGQIKQIKPEKEISGSGPELVRHIARHWPSCSVAQRWKKKPENKEVEKPLLPITLSYNAFHTPLWYKDRQLHQKLTLSPGNQTKASERWEAALNSDICLYTALLAPPIHWLCYVSFLMHFKNREKKSLIFKGWTPFTLELDFLVFSAHISAPLSL